MARLATTLVCFIVLAACASVAGPTTKTLSFASMQMLNEGVDGEWILGEFPDAREVVRRPDGTLQRLAYWVNDPHGRSRGLVMHFDRTGTLERKEYGGPVVRPPEKSDTFGFGS